MKSFFTSLLFLFLILILVLIVRTFTYQFKKIEKTRENAEVVNTIPAEKAIRRFVGGVRIPTISNEFYEETNFKPFEEFMKYLSDSYPDVYRYY